MASIMSDQPKNPCKGVVDAPTGLDAVIRLALAKAPDDRYPNAAAFGRDLVAAASGSGHVSAVDTLQARGRKRLLVRGLVAAIAGGLLLVGAAWGVARAGKLGPDALREGLLSLHAQAGALRGPDAPPLSELAERLDALEAQRAALLARATEEARAQPTGDQRRRLTALRAAHLLAAGDVEAAEALAAELADAADAEALAVRGGLAASRDGDAKAAARDLTRALARGVAWPEVRLWRLRARARAGLKGKSQAEDALADLDAAASISGGADRLQAEGLDVLRVEALLELDRLEEATAALAALGDRAPAGVRWQVALTHVEPVLETDPDAALALVKDLPPADEPAPAALAHSKRCDALLSTLVAEQVLDDDQRDRSTVLIRLRSHLTPGRPFPARVRAGLIKHTADFNAASTRLPVLELAAAFTAAVPDDFEAQKQVGQIALWLRKRAGCLILIPSLRRAVALAEDPEERLELEIVLLRNLTTAAVTSGGDPDDARAALDLAKVVLGHATDDHSRSWVHACRGRVHAFLGDLPAAKRELDAALDLREEVNFLLWRAKVLSGMRGHEDVAFKDAFAFVLSQSTASMQCDDAMAIAYDLGLRLGRLEQARRAIEWNLSMRPYHAGWQVRLALLRLDAGDAAAAREGLTAAARYFRERGGQVDRSVALDLAEQAERIRESVQTPAGRGQLAKLVEALDVERSKHPTRRGP
jgi:hypothetical protein